MGVSLGEVLVRGEARKATRWAAQGQSCVEELRGELSGDRRAVLPAAVADRELIDNLAVAVGAAAEAWPAAFLATFDDPAWHRDTFVLGGLGGVPAPRAGEILVAAAGDHDAWVRMAAVLALGRPAHRAVAVPVLAAALDDPEYLVRYHALAGLTTHADHRALPALTAFLERDDTADVERRMARAAQRAASGSGS